jgi:hypothetical protein
MSNLKKYLNPKTYLRFVLKRLNRLGYFNQTGSKVISMFPPGHFYSPLLDTQLIGPTDMGMPFDGEEWWEHIDLRPDAQRDYYQDLVDNYPFLDFPKKKNDSFRYFSENNWFPLGDAFALSSIIQKEKPRRIVEVGSGFSSAVILDTLGKTQSTAELTFIEPFPSRLESLLEEGDKFIAEIIVKRVQEVPMSVFEQLDPQDVLFIDSSHVAKIGSDLTFLILRVLPRLKPGVIVHFHDIFYPWSYPASWIRDGQSWNETLFLRAFLLGNPQFEIMAFNAYAGKNFAEIFHEKQPSFLTNSGGGFWIKKIS